MNQEKTTRLIELLGEIPKHKASMINGMGTKASFTCSTCGIWGKGHYKDMIEMLGHKCKPLPIRIGDVLSKIDSQDYEEIEFEKPEDEIEYRNNNPKYSISTYYYSSGESDFITISEYKKIKILLLWQNCGFTKSLNEIIKEDTEAGRALVEFLGNIFLK